MKYFNPVPLVASTIEQVGVAKYFTKHDPRNACHLIRFRVVDEWNTAFITNTGHYQGMPYGSSMGLLVFQAFINEILQEILHICIITYTDDILIKLLKKKKKRDTCSVAKALEELSSCQAGTSPESVNFLGYILKQRGVELDQSNVEAVTSWPQPTTVMEMQIFLWFYRFIIDDYWNYRLLNEML